MKLVLYGLNFTPELTGIGKYSGEMAQWLAEHGHDVTVITAAPYYPEWKVHEGYVGLRWRSETVAVKGPGRLTVLRCPLWVPARVTGLKRLIHLFSFALSSLLPMLRAVARRPDLVLTVAPALIVAPQSAVLCKLFRRKAWLHIQDFEVDAAIGMGIVNAGPLTRVIVGVERFLLGCFDRVSTISEAMKRRLLTKGVPAERALMLRNWVNLNDIAPWQGPNGYRQQLRLSDEQVLVLYAGNMGEKQGLDIVIDAARQLLPQQATIHFLMVGTGAARERLQHSASDLSNMTWWPLQPLERLNELLNAADIHVLPQRADAADLVMPSKLNGMLASGRAVVGTASADTELGAVLDAVGARVEPGDATQLTAQLQAWVADPDARLRKGAQGRRFAEEHLDVDAVMKRFVEDANRLIGNRARA